MIDLWYNSDEVTGYHPVVENAIANAITNCGYDSHWVLEHHPCIPGSTIVPDFAIKLRSSNRYIFVIEVKKTARDVTSQRYQNQCRSYVSDFASHWEPNYPKYFCLTNIEELILFADRNGPISTCVLKGNPRSHTPFNPVNRDASQAVAEFQKTMEKILPLVYMRASPEWDNNWQPIIDTFYQNFQSVSSSLTYDRELSDELSLYEFFRLLAFTYLKDYYHQTSNPHEKYFRSLPSDADNLQSFTNKLANNYNRVLQLDFNQVFANHPNSTDRIFPENFNDPLIQYFKDTIRTLNSYGAQAVSDNPLPQYIFNLLTSKVYDKKTLHKKGKIMSDTELSILLATLTIDSADSTVLDPCSGDGALLDAAYDYINLLSLSMGATKAHNQILDQVSGIEIDPFLAQLSTFRLLSKNLNGVTSSTLANIITGNSFNHPNGNGFDVLLMNPPFLRNDDPTAPISAADKMLMNSAIVASGQQNFVNLASQPNLYFYFVNYAWHYLKAQGKAGFILMAKFLNNEEGEHLKRFLLDKVEAIILYPRNYFEDFKVTTVITLLSKQPANQIKFLRIINPDLLTRPGDIKSILSSNSNTRITADFALKVTDRNIDPADNWKIYFSDPEGTFERLDTLSCLVPLTSFFSVLKRGGAESTGGSKIIFPDFNSSPYSGIQPAHKGFGISNNKILRALVLTSANLTKETAIHFPDRYDSATANGLGAVHQSDSALDSVFDTNNAIEATKWKKIVDAAYRNKITFDILIPRAERTKHACYYNPFNTPVVLTTNFFYLSGFQNGNGSAAVTEESQIKFITAYLNSCFGQIQFEIHSNNQEGMRKLEGFHVEEYKVPDLSQMTGAEIGSVVTAFENLSRLNLAISGDEGLSSPRRALDEEIGKVIFARNTLGFGSSGELTDFFELFLAELVEDRRL